MAERDRKMVKHIFTVSFTLQAIGWSELSLAALFVLTDIWKIRKGTGLLLLFGQFALTAYLAEAVFRKACYAVSDRVFIGLQNLVPTLYAPVVAAVGYGIVVVAVVMIRRQCALEMGLIVPTIRIRDNIQLKPNIYVIKLKGIEVARGELLLDQFLAMNSGTAMETIPGMETVEPAFGLPALWIQESNREQAELAGYTVVDPISVLTTHLTEVIKSHASEILGRQETQTLVDAVKQSHAAVVEDLVPAMLSVGELQKVLCNLLRERISIRDLVTILETLGDYVAMTKDTEILTEYVRQALARQISRQYAANGTLVCLAVDQELEQLILAGVQRSEQGSFVALEPQKLQALVNCLSKELPKLTEIGYQPIVLVSPGCRLYFRKLTERVAENLIILSYAELEPNVQIQTLGMVKV